MLSKAQPVVSDDTYEVNIDGILDVAGPGILTNDTAGEGEVMTAVMVDPPANGTLILNPDGSFTYTPDPGFEGTDSFTYIARTPAINVIEVDSTTSDVNFDATLSTDLGSASDGSVSRVGGELYVVVSPNEAPLDWVHILDGYLSMLDAIDISFEYEVLGINLGSIDVEAPPKGISLTITDPGPMAPVVNTVFNQEDNKVTIESTVWMTGSGLFTSIDPGERTLETETDQDIGGEVTVTDSELQVNLPLEISGTFDLEGNEVVVTIDGSLDATGPLLPPLDSEVATVTLNVGTSGTGIQDEIAQRFVLEQNYPNPFDTETVIKFSVSRTGHVNLTVYDQLGRTVETLVDRMLLPGQYTTRFSGANLANGVYLYRLEAEGYIETRRLIKVR